MSRKITKIGIGPVLLIVAALLSIVASIIVTYTYHTNADVATSKRARRLSQQVRRHINIPVNEVPALVEISDAAKLKGQPFFATSQNGDVVLLFKSSRQAVVYREAGDIVVASGELTALPSQ